MRINVIENHEIGIILQNTCVKLKVAPACQKIFTNLYHTFAKISRRQVSTLSPTTMPSRQAQRRFLSKFRIFEAILCPTYNILPLILSTDKYCRIPPTLQLDSFGTPCSECRQIVQIINQQIVFVQ